MSYRRDETRERLDRTRNDHDQTNGRLRQQKLSRVRGLGQSRTPDRTPDYDRRSSSRVSPRPRYSGLSSDHLPLLPADRPAAFPHGCLCSPGLLPGLCATRLRRQPLRFASGYGPSALDCAALAADWRVGPGESLVVAAATSAADDWEEKRPLRASLKAWSGRG